MRKSPEEHAVYLIEDYGYETIEGALYHAEDMCKVMKRAVKDAQIKRLPTKPFSESVKWWNEVVSCMAKY